MRVLFLSESGIPDKVTRETLGLGEIRVIAAQTNVSDVFVLGPRGRCFYDLPSTANQSEMEKKIKLCHFTWGSSLLAYYFTWIPLLWRGFYLCRQDSFELIQAESPHVSGIAAVILSWWFRPKCVIEYRVSYEAVARSRYGAVMGGLAGWGFRWLAGWVSRRADLILANCELAKKDFGKQYPAVKRLGNYNAGVRVPADFKHLSAEKFRVGFLGRLYPDKGVMYFLRGVKHQAEWFWSHRVQFLVGGEGPERDMAQKFVTDNGLREIVRFEGTVDRWKFLSGVDLVVNTTIVKAALEMAIAEAQSVGLPVVAFGTEGFPETVVNGHGGYLVPVKQVKQLSIQIRRLIEDKKLYQKMSLTAIREAKRYRFETQVDQLRQAYGLIFLTMSR